jgi:hypothetical protein
VLAVAHRTIGLVVAGFVPFGLAHQIQQPGLLASGDELLQALVTAAFLVFSPLTAKA